MTREQKREHARKAINILLNSKITKEMEQDEIIRLSNLLDFATYSPQLDAMQTREQINALLIMIINGFVIGLGYNPDQIEGLIK